MTDADRRAQIQAGLALLLSIAGTVASPLRATEVSAVVLTSDEEARVVRGEIVVRAEVDDAADGGAFAAAVLVPAAPGRVFEVMTDCRQALRYVPNLERCEVLERDPDGRYEVIEHVVDLGWYVPATRYTFRAYYDAGRSVRFEHVSGDFERNEGRWDLTPRDSEQATLVTYRVRLKLRAPVPRWIVRRSLRQDLPRLLRALHGYAGQRDADP